MSVISIANSQIGYSETGELDEYDSSLFNDEDDSYEGDEFDKQYDQMH